MTKRDKIVYHGWIVKHAEQGYTDLFYVEFMEGDARRRIRIGHSPAEAVEWWDKKVGKKVKLLPTPLQAYRVYTYEDNEETNEENVNDQT